MSNSPTWGKLGQIHESSDLKQSTCRKDTMPANNHAMPKIQKIPQDTRWDYRVCAAPDCEERIHRFMKERWGKKVPLWRMQANDRETATRATEAGEVGQTVRVGESKEDLALMWSQVVIKNGLRPVHIVQFRRSIRSKTGSNLWGINGASGAPEGNVLGYWRKIWPI